MKQIDAINTLNKQHEQIKSIIYSLSINEHFADISNQVVAGNLWAAGDLIVQAEKTANDLYELIKQQGDSKPDTPTQGGEL